MQRVTRWILPVLATSLWLLAWVKFIQAAVDNVPPLRLLAQEGPGPFREKEVARARCVFQGQVLVQGETLWRLCPLDSQRWEVVRWNFHTGRVERGWTVRGRPGRQGVSVSHGLLQPPAIHAAALRPDGDPVLVVQGLKTGDRPQLIHVRRGGGLRITDLTNIVPWSLRGLAAQQNRTELVTRDCRLHVVRAGRPPSHTRLAGCHQEPAATRLELALHRKTGWHLVQSSPPEPAGDRRSRFTLRKGPAADPIVLGTLQAPTTKNPRGEQLDTTPSGVILTQPTRWPTHTVRDEKLVPLQRPPAALLDGLADVSQIAFQLISLDRRGLDRYWEWHAVHTRRSRQTGQRTIQRWRWLLRLPGGWVATEALGRKRGIALATARPPRQGRVQVRTVPGFLHVIPARRGGYWVFGSVGHYFRVSQKLRRTDAPGFFERLGRIWRLQHLQRSHLEGVGPNHRRRSRARLMADRWSLPVVLLTFPLGLLLVAPPSLVRARKKKLERPLRDGLFKPGLGLILVSGLYLLLAGPLLFSFLGVLRVF